MIRSARVRDGILSSRCVSEMRGSAPDDRDGRDDGTVGMVGSFFRCSALDSDRVIIALGFVYGLTRCV